jgi:hypothetical protein
MILLLYGMTLSFIRQAREKKLKKPGGELQIPALGLPKQDQYDCQSQPAAFINK